jgi:hypothetical protein
MPIEIITRSYDMANQESSGGEKGKTIGFYFVFLILAAAYYYFLDWVMMGPMQNLPFPYK